MDCPEELSKISGFVATNTAEKCPNVLVKNKWVLAANSMSHQKYPVVLEKPQLNKCPVFGGRGHGVISQSWRERSINSMYN